MSLAFMLGGLAIVPFNREFLGAAQLLMSGSMASCYILCYTIACMPAYRDGTSSAAMCAVMRLIVIAASWVGAGVGTLVDDEGLYVIITVTGVSLVAISVVGITRGQRFNPLLLSQEPSGGDVSATDESLRRAAAEHGLSEREETLLLMVAHGQGPRDISEALFITQSGVRAHLSRIYKKVEVHSQEELVRALEGR